MKNLFYIIGILSVLSISDVTYSQNYQTESKSCGSCGKSVSINSKVGMRCPHCNVIWGTENTSTKNNGYSNNYKSYETPSYGYTYGGANIRKGASTRYDIIATLPSNSKIDIISKSGDWYYVDYVYEYSFPKKSITGYIHKTSIRF